MEDHSSIGSSESAVALNNSSERTSNEYAIKGLMLDLPLSFVENKGQASGEIAYMTKTPEQAVFFTPSEAIFIISSGNNSSLVNMTFEGAGAPDIVAQDPLPGKVNFLIGNDSTKWVTDLPTYSAIRYQDLYPGIDLVFRGREGILKHEFLVKPGADPSRITLAYDGQDNLSLDENGSLVISAPAGNLTDSRPIIYQDIDGKRIAVDGEYRLIDDVRVGFEIGKYDDSYPLVIDPLLKYSTYLGGSGDDDGLGIAVDGSGNAYVTGRTASLNFPTLDPFHGSYAGGQDAFVTKLNSAGSAQYSTYLGGSGLDSGNGIAVDGSGNAYVSGGTTSSNFPTLNPFQGSPAGSQDAFVTKLNPAGNALLYSTYLGGSGSDYSMRMAVDGSGNAYLTGSTASSNFPTLNPFQGTHGGNDDAFVTKLNSAGALVYSTYLGGSNHERGNGIDADSSGNAYVTGQTQSGNFPRLNPFQNFHAGGTWDAFVTKLNAAGALVYSTYLGGLVDDLGIGINVDSSGNAYVAGITSSLNFPLQNPFQGSNAGSSDAFVTKFNPAGNALLYSTYLGGSSIDDTWDMDMDGSGNVYLTGYTTSSNFPTLNPFQGSNAGSPDAFVTKLNAAGNALSYSTYLGGSGSDYGRGIAVDGSGNAYLTGYIASSNFPTLNPFQGSYGGGPWDAFVAAFLAQTACISGYKLNETGEGLAGWKIFVDSNTNGQLDMGEKNATTNSMGYWQICGLLPGSYTVCETPQEGWAQLDPVGCRTATIADPPLPVGGLNFTNSKLGCLSGYDLDGCTPAPHSGLSGWTIFIDSNANGTFEWGEKNVTTDASGYWEICSLENGTYAICEDLKPGWSQTSLPISYTKVLEGTNITEINFTNQADWCTQSLTQDLGVSKVALLNGIPVQQVDPGQIFHYNITVTNKDQFNDTPLVLVTDKLPYEVEYVGAEVYPAAPQDYSIKQSGDLIYVRFDSISAGSTRYINITVKAPSQAPTTLYDTVNLRYRNDQNLSDNRMTIQTYVVQLGYNQTLAAFSFEDLLHSQSQLLFQFEDLLHTIPGNNSTNYSFLVSFEQLLRSQSNLTSSFEDLLSNESSTGWDGEYSEENRTYLLRSYRQMLWDQAFLFASFDMKIKDSWMSLCDYTPDGHSQDAQTELAASFEDLLKRQTRLYKSFNLLLDKINISSHQDMIDFLAAYENLLRVEANLLMSFNELLDMKYENAICP